MRIEQLRVAQNMTQGELAEALNVDRSTVTKWETGVAMPTAAKIPQLAEALGCTINDLFKKEDSNG